jgi:hypothetical protein
VPSAGNEDAKPIKFINNFFSRGEQLLQENKLRQDRSKFSSFLNSPQILSARGSEEDAGLAAGNNYSLPVTH